MCPLNVGQYSARQLRSALFWTILRVSIRPSKYPWTATLVYSEFVKVQHAGPKQIRRDVIRRRRELLLAMSPGAEYALNELTVLSPEVARMYATLSPRTLLRDVAELQAMNLIVATEDRWRANLELLMPECAGELGPG